MDKYRKIEFIDASHVADAKSLVLQKRVVHSHAARQAIARKRLDRVRDYQKQKAQQVLGPGQNHDSIVKRQKNVPNSVSAAEPPQLSANPLLMHLEGPRAHARVMTKQEREYFHHC